MARAAKNPTTSDTSEKPAPAKTAKADSTAKPAAKAAASKTTTAKAPAAKPAAAKAPAPKKTPAASAKAEAAATAAPAPVKLSATDEKLHKKLLEERERLMHQAAELEAETQALAADPEAAEMNSDLESGDCMASVEREKDAQLSRQFKAMLFEVDKALAKLETGTYGMCERCKQPIPKARLQALPYAELCVPCQQKRERLLI